MTKGLSLQNIFMLVVKIKTLMKEPSLLLSAVFCNANPILCMHAIFNLPSNDADALKLLCSLHFSLLQHYLKRREIKSKQTYLIGKKEIKILALFSYYTIVYLLYITFATTFFMEYSNPSNAIQDYFMCEALGYNPSQPCASPDDIAFSVSAAVTLGVLLEATFPLANLIFVIDGGGAKKLLKKLTSWITKIFKN